MSSAEESSTPVLPSDSPGSSVSSALQEEYDELLKYAIITPHLDPLNLPKTLAEAATYPSRPRTEVPIVIQDTSSETEMSEVDSRQLRSDNGIQSMMAQRGSSTCSEGFNSGNEAEDGNTSSNTGACPPPLGFSHPAAERTPHRPLPSSGMFQTPSSERSSSTLADTPESSGGLSPAVDQDIARMAANLDNWCLDLKRNVLAEFSQSKIALIERHRIEINTIKGRHNKQIDQLYNEIGNLKELIHTYEQTVERKDQVITNLTRAVQKQKERFEMLKRFESWKLRHSEDRREAFTSRLAQRHHERRMMNKVWSAWHSIIEAKWRQRVEKACQAKAQEVCINLTNDYEARIASLNEAQEASRSEVTRLHAERDHYEETMKKAFMRGVCALNMEAMTMFNEGEENQDQMPDMRPPPDPRSGGPPPPFTMGHAYQGPPTTSSGHVYQGPSTSGQGQSGVGSSQGYSGGHAGPGRIVTSEGALTPDTVTLTHSAPGGRRQTTQSKVTTTSSQQRSSSTFKTRITAGHGTSKTLAPPMSSVVVERHHPVTKQTVGHATAAKYPSSQRPLQGPQGIHVRPGPIGQTGPASRGGRGAAKKQGGMQTVKVVH